MQLRWRALWSGGLLAILGACLGPADGPLALEPDYAGLGADCPDGQIATGPSQKCLPIPLTIFLSELQTNIRKISQGPAVEIEPQTRDLLRDRQGVFHLDGLAISDRTMLIIEGKLHRFDGPVEDHLLVVQPRFISHEDGAANEAGFLQVDLKQTDRIDVYRQGWPLGTQAGIFRGRIIATDRLRPHQRPRADLESYVLLPALYGQRPPNLIGHVSDGEAGQAVLEIRPNIFLTKVLPDLGDDPCMGAQVVNGTLAGTTLKVQAQVEGFPYHRPVTIEAHYWRPRATAEGVWGQWTDAYMDSMTYYLRDQMEEVVETRVIQDPSGAGPAVVDLPNLTTLLPPLDSDIYGMQIELVAYNEVDRGPKVELVHQVVVVNREQQVILDHFEVCPPEDLGCQDRLDGTAPENVRARHDVVGWLARQQGLFEKKPMPLTQCQGGRLAAGSFNDACDAYLESSDTNLTRRIAAQFDFSLTVDGQAQAHGDWGRALPGIGDAQVRAQLKTTFRLQSDLSSSYAASESWLHHEDMTVLYNPTRTSIQWWRVATPRVRYAQIGEMDVCGMQSRSHDLFLTDVSEAGRSRQVLACADLPSTDSACFEIAPTPDHTGAACKARLIAPSSTEGKRCLQTAQARTTSDE